MYFLFVISIKKIIVINLYEPKLFIVVFYYFVFICFNKFSCNSLYFINFCNIYYLIQEKKLNFSSKILQLCIHVSINIFVSFNLRIIINPIIPFSPNISDNLSCRVIYFLFLLSLLTQHKYSFCRYMVEKLKRKVEFFLLDQIVNVQKLINTIITGKSNKNETKIKYQFALSKKL